MLRYKELIQATLAGEATSNTPVLMWKHHPELDQEAEMLTCATVEFQDKFDCDIVKISPASTYQLKDYGLVDAWQGDSIGRRAVTKTVIHSPDDWRRLPAIDPGAGFTSRFLECARLVRRHYPAHVPVVITVFNPMFQAATLAGIDLLKAHLRDHPEAVEEGLERLLGNTLSYIDRLIDEGVDGVFLASQQAQASVLPAEIYARHALPGDLACLKATTGLPLNLLHLHGAGVHADLFAGLGDVVLHYEMDPQSPLPWDLLARGQAVSSGPCPAWLESNPPAAEIRAACAAVLDRCRGPGFILSPGCSIRLATVPATLHAVTQAARPQPSRARRAA